MKIERIKTATSCKICQNKVAFKLDSSLSKDILSLLVTNGFTELAHFTKIGIIYAESVDLVISGAFGQNLLQTHCKSKNCQEALNSLEEVLSKME